MKTVVLVIVSALISGGLVYTLIQEPQVNNSNQIKISKTEEVKINSRHKKAMPESDAQLNLPKTSQANAALLKENKALKQQIAELEKSQTSHDDKLAEIQKDLKEIKKDQSKSRDFSHFLPEFKTLDEIAKELDLSSYEIEEIKKIESEEEKLQSKMLSELLSKRSEENPEDMIIEAGMGMFKKMNELKQNHNKKITDLLGDEKGKKFNKMRGPGNMTMNLDSDIIDDIETDK